MRAQVGRDIKQQQFSNSKFLLLSRPSCFKQFLLSLFKSPQGNEKKFISTTSQCWICKIVDKLKKNKFMTDRLGKSC